MSTVQDAIDGASDDWTVSQTAMRWSGPAPTAGWVAEQLPSRVLRFTNPCPICDLRALATGNGLIAICQNCGYEHAAGELTINAGWAALFAQKQDTNVVYYVRFGDRVKIGTTSNLRRRLDALPCDELLATEPGSYDLEKRRHVQLRGSRIYANREWFHLTDEVRAHIASLR